MGDWKPAHWYDDTEKWMHELKYKPPWPAKAWWVHRFSEMARKVDDPHRPILDLGCGNGLFPAFLNERDYEGQYVGLDFSDGSLARASRGNWEEGGLATAKFFQCDLEQADVGQLLEKYFPGENPLVTCAEVLEHMKDDVRLLMTIPTGVEVMLTIPRADAEAHVRCFPNPEDVLYRYGHLFGDVQLTWLRHPSRQRTGWCHMLRGVRK